VIQLSPRCRSVTAVSHGKKIEEGSGLPVGSKRSTAGRRVFVGWNSRRNGAGIGFLGFCRFPAQEDGAQVPLTSEAGAAEETNGIKKRTGRSDGGCADERGRGAVEDEVSALKAQLQNCG